MVQRCSKRGAWFAHVWSVVLEVVACFAEDFIRGAFLSGRDSTTLWVKETLTEEEKYAEEPLQDTWVILSHVTLNTFELWLYMTYTVHIIHILILYLRHCTCTIYTWSSRAHSDPTDCKEWQIVCYKPFGIPARSCQSCNALKMSSRTWFLPCGLRKFRRTRRRTTTTRCTCLRPWRLKLLPQMVQSLKAAV